MTSTHKVSAGSAGRARVISLYREGHGTGHIAELIPISQRSVQSVLVKEGLRDPRTPALTALKRQQINGLARLGIARENIAAVTGCSSAQVRTVVTDLRRRGDIAPDIETLTALLRVLGLAG